MSQARTPRRTENQVTNGSLAKNAVRLGVALALGTALAATATVSQAQPAASQWASGRILVKGAPGVSDEKMDQILAAHRGHSAGKIHQTGVHIVQIPAQAEEHVIAALAHNPNIEFAEKDMLIPAAEVIPNDPNFTSQWHLTKIGTTTAWDSTAGSGITVAVLDSGVDPTHPELATKLLPGYNAVDGAAGNTADINGHGTAVAGTVGAIANNSTSVASVAYDVMILPVRISNTSDGYAYWSNVARGLTWAADHGARVANVSYGISGSSTVASSAQYFKSKGGLVVASAMNNGTDIGLPDDPNIITVSATDSNDAMASWSSFGDIVDVSAPGVSILTTTNGGGTGTWNGTSFSSPVTAGVVAMIMAANSALSPSEVENVLESTAKDFGAAGKDKYYGYGRVDASAAVAKALILKSVIDTTAPTSSISLVNGSTVTGTQTVNVSATDAVGVTKAELYVGGTLLGSDTSAPFSFVWDTTTAVNGTKTVEARAYDAAGNIGTASVNVTVDNPVVIDSAPPTVAILSPSSGSLVSGTVNFAIGASDNIGVAWLGCYVDGRLLSTATNVSSLTCNWNTRKAVRGTHTLTATAKDAAGNTANASISVLK